MVWEFLALRHDQQQHDTLVKSVCASCQILKCKMPNCQTVHGLQVWRAEELINLINLIDELITCFRTITSFCMHRIIASCFVSILRLALLAFLLIFVFPSSFRRPCYRAIHERLSMNERAARHEVITLGTAEGSQGETRKKSLT